MKKVDIFSSYTRYSLPLGIILASSPLPPLATIERLRNMGYSLPDVDALLERPDDYGELLRLAVECQRAGSREALVKWLEEQFNRIRTTLELADYNIGQIFNLIMMFSTTLPLILASVVMLVQPSSAFWMLSLSAGLAILSSFFALSVFPSDLRMPTRKRLLVLGALPVTALAISQALEIDPLVVIALLSVPGFITSTAILKKEIANIRRVGSMIRKSLDCPFSIFICLSVDDPEQLISLEVSGVAAAALHTLYILGIFGGHMTKRGLSLLADLYTRYISLFESVRTKTRVVLIHACIGCFVTAVGFSILLTLLNSIVAYGAAIPFIHPQPATSIEKYIRLALALDAIALSVGTASSREGNPAYFTLYLPIACGVMLLGLLAGNIASGYLLG